MKKFASILTLLALYSATVLPTAKAQDLGGVFDLGQLGRDLSFSASMRAQSQRDAKRLRGRSGRATKKNTVRTGSTRFQPSQAARQRNLAQFVAKIRQTSPTEAASLQQSFAKGDPIAAIAPGLRRYNLRTDDVADAATAYLVSAWYGVRGRNDDPSVAIVNGVRQQMRTVMLSTPGFVSASNATKQEMAEAMLIQTMVTDALITSAKGKPEQMAKVKAAINQGARNSFKLDLAKMKLSSRGLQM